MASRSTHAPTSPRMVTPPERFRYETRNPERAPVGYGEEAEPRLGPYETRYAIELGYPDQTRTID